MSDAYERCDTCMHNDGCSKCGGNEMKIDKVTKDTYNYWVFSKDDSVTRYRHATSLASERELSENELVVAALCEKIMEWEATQWKNG